MPRNKKPGLSEFTAKIRCGLCGANFQRKTSNAGTKYPTYKWACSTHHAKGAAHCCMKPIPEEVLKQLVTDVLKLDCYNPLKISEKIIRMLIPRYGEVEFELVGGHKALRTWGYPSRSQSWTDEMRRSCGAKTKQRWEMKHAQG